MKNFILTIIALFTASVGFAQVNEREDVFYTASGIGLSFPIGESTDYLKPRISNSLGANIGLGRTGGLFLYPKVSLHAFQFDQLINEPGNPVLVKDGRSTTYLLNVNLGYRGTTGNFSYYAFAGGGGGLILTQRATLNAGAGTVTMRNKNTTTGTMEAGGGLEYRLGTFILFTEASYLRAFEEFEGRTFNTIPVAVGFKTDLSKVFRKRS